MKNIILNVEGMSCDHCVHTIEGALNALEGVCHSKVNLQEKSVEVRYDSEKIGLEQLKLTVEDTGYEVVDQPIEFKSDNQHPNKEGHCCGGHKHGDEHKEHCHNHAHHSK